jgi:hypothetical protein
LPGQAIIAEVWALRITTRYRALRIALFGCVILAAFAWHPARAAERHAPKYLAGENQREDSRYFVDFHARGKPSFPGHVFIVYGQLNARGGIVEAQVVGFTPDSDRYLTTYIIPVPGLIGQRNADLTEPSTVVYRRHLTAAEFHQLTAKVRQIRVMHPMWHLIFSNCNDFVGAIAKSIGLRRPPSLLLPSDYVSLLRKLNET